LDEVITSYLRLITILSKTILTCTNYSTCQYCPRWYSYTCTNCSTCEHCPRWYLYASIIL